MARRDPVAEYMAAHPDRVHGGVTPTPATARARAVLTVPREGSQLWGYCSVTGEAVYGTKDGATKHDHPRRGCRVEYRVGGYQPDRWSHG